MIDLGQAPPQRPEHLAGLYNEGAAMMTAEDIFNILGGKPKTGGGFMVCCPAHDDRNPSLSIDDGDNGRPLVNCLAGCAQSAVLDALKQRGAWPDNEKQFSPTERQALKEGAEKAKAERIAKDKAKHAAAAETANATYENAKADPLKHPYTIKKSVHLGHLVKRGPWSQRGWADVLIIPLYASDKSLASLQAINADGAKDFLTGGKTKGCFHPIGKISGTTGLLVIGEGWATVAAVCGVMGCPGVAAFSAGNLEAVAREIKNLAPLADIVIIADDDQKADGSDVGKVAAIGAALAIGCKYAIPDMGKKADFWDVLNELGADAVKKRIQAAVFPNVRSPELSRDRAFKFISSSDLISNCGPTKWLIKNYLEQNTTTSVFGAAGSGKTFITLDMGLSIATGKPWYGHRVEQGPVLYICGEGKNGIAKRINAWELHHKSKAPLFFISNFAGQMLDPDSLAEIETAAQGVAVGHGTPVLIIIDTLNRNFGPGDENSTSDMTSFIQAVDHLRGRLHCSILIVHHSGLGDTGRGRGSSALRGAMDFEYTIEKNGGNLIDQIITLSNTKTKDHEPPPTVSFKPVLIDLGQIDEDGKPITSLALEQTDRKATRRTKKLSGANRIALDALKSVALESGEATEDAWRNEAYARGISTAEKDAKRKAFTRARGYLLENNFIATRDNIYWIQGRDYGTKPDKTGQCPDVSTLDTRTDIDTLLKECPVVRLRSDEKVQILMGDDNAEFF